MRESECFIEIDSQRERALKRGDANGQFANAVNACREVSSLERPRTYGVVLCLGHRGRTQPGDPGLLVCHVFDDLGINSKPPQSWRKMTGIFLLTALLALDDHLRL